MCTVAWNWIGCVNVNKRLDRACRIHHFLFNNLEDKVPKNHRQIILLAIRIMQYTTHKKPSKPDLILQQSCTLRDLRGTILQGNPHILYLDRDLRRYLLIFLALTSILSRRKRCQHQQVGLETTRVVLTPTVICVSTRLWKLQRSRRKSPSLSLNIGRVLLFATDNRVET